MPAPSVWLASLITSIFLAYSTLGTGWAGSVVHFKPFRAPGETSEILVGLVWAERVQHVKDPLTDLPTTQHNFTSAVAMLEELNGVTRPRKRRQVTDLSVLSTARALLITATALSALKTLALTALFYGVHTPVLRKALYFAAGTLAFSCSLLSTVAVVVWSGADVEGVMCDAVNILIDSRSRREDVNTTATCGLGSASALCMFNIALFMLEGITDLYWLRADLSVIFGAFLVTALLTYIAFGWSWGAVRLTLPTPQNSTVTRQVNLGLQWTQNTTFDFVNAGSSEPGSMQVYEPLSALLQPLNEAAGGGSSTNSTAPPVQAVSPTSQPHTAFALLATALAVQGACCLTLLYASLGVAGPGSRTALWLCTVALPLLAAACLAAGSAVWLQAGVMDAVCSWLRNTTADSAGTTVACSDPVSLPLVVTTGALLLCQAVGTGAALREDALEAVQHEVSGSPSEGYGPWARKRGASTAQPTTRNPMVQRGRAQARPGEGRDRAPSLPTSPRGRAPSLPTSGRDRAPSTSRGKVSGSPRRDGDSKAESMRERAISLSRQAPRASFATAFGPGSERTLRSGSVLRRGAV